MRTGTSVWRAQGFTAKTTHKPGRVEAPSIARHCQSKSSKVLLAPVGYEGWVDPGGGGFCWVWSGGEVREGQNLINLKAGVPFAHVAGHGLFGNDGP